MAFSRTGPAVLAISMAVASLVAAGQAAPWTSQHLTHPLPRQGFKPGIFSVDGPGCSLKTCVFRPGQVYTVKGMGFGNTPNRVRLMSISLGRDNPDPYGNFPTPDNNLDLLVRSWSDAVVVVAVPDPLPAASLRYEPISKVDLSVYPGGSDAVYDREVAFHP